MPQMACEYYRCPSLPLSTLSCRQDTHEFAENSALRFTRFRLPATDLRRANPIASHSAERSPGRDKCKFLEPMVGQLRPIYRSPLSCQAINPPSFYNIARVLRVFIHRWIKYLTLFRIVYVPFDSNTRRYLQRGQTHSPAITSVVRKPLHE